MFPQLPASVRVFLCTRPTDMRKSFDGLQGMVREFLGQDPLSGHLFLFLNRRRDRVRFRGQVPGTPYVIIDRWSRAW
jgi:transposase